MVDINEEKYDAMQQQLQMIIDISFGYDGYHNANDLKSLIDEIAEMAKNGLDGIRPIWISNNEVYETVSTDEGFIERKIPIDKIPDYAKNYLVKK